MRSRMSLHIARMDGLLNITAPTEQKVPVVKYIKYTMHQRKTILLLRMIPKMVK